MSLAEKLTEQILQQRGIIENAIQSKFPGLSLDVRFFFDEGKDESLIRWDINADKNTVLAQFAGDSIEATTRLREFVRHM